MPENANSVLREDVIKFSGIINDENISRLISYISTLDINAPLRIYFTTPGGEINNGDIFIDYLNHLVKNGKIITLIASWEMSSMGLIIPLKANCDIELLNTYSILHIGTRNLDYRESLKKDSIESFNYIILEKTNQRLLKLYEESGITEQEIDSIKRGNDVFLDTERLRCLIKHRGN